MSDYPVGASWKATNKYGDSVTIYLEERGKSVEKWRWVFTYSDGSTGPYNSDWGTSYRSVYNQSIGKLWIKGEKMPRFKRIK